MVIGSHGELIPRLVQEMPSVEKGTWKVLPDGRMDVTWTLRPNIKWHDGRPLTSDDVLFAWEYLTSPGSQMAKQAWVPSVDAFSAPDPMTFVVQFKRPYALVERIGKGTSDDFRPLPRHILGELLARGDIDAFNNSSHWRNDYIGVGPYRLARWEAGSHIQFTRSDDYFLGRPPLDGIIYTFHPDANGLLASLLAGSLDVHLPRGLDLSQATELKQRWEGTGHQVLISPDGKMKGLGPQFRPEIARPAALLERPVREALFRGLDRASIVQAGARGLAPIADSWVPPDDLQHQITSYANSIIPYPYDPARAQSILEAQG